MGIAQSRCHDPAETVLTVGEDLPGVSGPTAARNWTKIKERMRNVFAQFAKFHDAPEVFSPPYAAMDMPEKSAR